MNKKVLVTGADGLLGSNVVRKLLDKEYEVKVLLHPDSKSTTLKELPIKESRKDIAEDGESLAREMDGYDIVMHLAAITNQWASAELTWKVNYDGTKNVLDAAVKAGVAKFIFTGSASSFQFGTIENPGDESAGFPDNYKGIAYMESKHKAMDLVKEYVEQKKIEAVIGVPTFMLGEYDFGPSSGELIKQFIQKELKFVSPGGRNFGHAKDVAGGMVSAIEKGKNGECYIFGGENLTYLDFFSKTADIAGISAPKIVLPGPIVLLGGALGSAYEKISGKNALINSNIAKLSLCGTYYSSKKAISELGMEQTSVETSIEDSIKSLKKYGHL
jgi:dihydroflavonol-4-reductase